MFQASKNEAIQIANIYNFKTAMYTWTTDNTPPGYTVLPIGAYESNGVFFS